VKPIERRLMPRKGFLRKREKSSDAFAEDVAFTTPETDGGLYKIQRTIPRNKLPSIRGL
jgi:hypothetical protein